MRLANHLSLSAILVGFTSGHLFAQENGLFSSWKDLPKIIDSIDENNPRQQLDQLHELTWIKLGYPQAAMCLNKEDHQSYMLQTKQRWQQWWESTGKPISKQKELDAKTDQQAFQVGWDFLGIEKEPPKSIPPVWSPKSWTLYVTFSNGDYMGREKELWIMDRQASSVSLSKLRGDYSQGGWNWGVVLSEFIGVSPDRADQVLKAMCYVHCYAPATGAEVAEDKLPGLYYPHSTLHLRDSDNRILWNTEGYEICKTRPEFGDGVAGRSYYFLRTIFPDSKNWKESLKPTSEQLAPYRRFLSFSKPYFCSNAREIVEMFGERGGRLERDSMLDWAEKQKSATDPEMDWKVCSSDFGTGSKVNVINFTRLQIQKTLVEIESIGDRLDKNQHEPAENNAGRAKQRELERYVADMIAVKKTEEKEAVERYPQPLRDLINADEHPDDSDLKHLSAAVQAIRENPDSRLFKQLVQELDEDTLRMRSLLRHILLNEHGILKLKPWEDQQEAIAINACIDALPDAGAANDALIETLLHVYGGGKIEIEGKNGGRSIELTVKKNGYRMTLGNSSHPLSLEETQKELRRLYAKSKSSPRGSYQIATPDDEPR